MKVKPLNDQDGNLAGYITGTCPGCGTTHFFRTVPDGDRPCWKFINGDLNNPTFKPSLVEWWGGDWTREGAAHRCHFFLTNGQLQFLADSLHDLAGQTVELPDIEPTE